MPSEGEPEGVLVVGGNSTIGGALISRLDQVGLSVVWTTRRWGELGDRSLYVDLDEDQSTWNLSEESFSSAVFCAAATSISACESHPDATRKINVDQTVKLADRLLANGTFVVFLSTDMVFDGSQPLARTHQDPNPVTQYGLQKADVERKLLSRSDQVAVVRLGKVVGPQTSVFSEWITDLTSGVVIHPFSDATMAPISLGCVVGLLVDIATNRRGGIFHATGPTDVTYADAAYWIAHRMGVEDRLVVPIPGDHLSGDQQPAKHKALHTPMDLTEIGTTGIDALEELFSV